MPRIQPSKPPPRSITEARLSSPSHSSPPSLALSTWRPPSGRTPARMDRCAHRVSNQSKLSPRSFADKPRPFAIPSSVRTCKPAAISSMSMCALPLFIDEAKEAGRLPLGESHHHRPLFQEARGRHRHRLHIAYALRRRLAFRWLAWLRSRPGQRLSRRQGRACRLLILS